MIYVYFETRLMFFEKTCTKKLIIENYLFELADNMTQLNTTLELLILKKNRFDEETNDKIKSLFFKQDNCFKTKIII